jgi:hypothetical protein
MYIYEGFSSYFQNKATTVISYAMIPVLENGFFLDFNLIDEPIK